jgi:hypothetical protein
MFFYKHIGQNYFPKNLNFQTSGVGPGQFPKSGGKELYIFNRQSQKKFRPEEGAISFETLP